MLVRIDPAACAVVVDRLRAVADEVEDQHHRVTRAAAGVYQGVPSLAGVPAMAQELRDRAADLQRRADLAVALNQAPVSLASHVVTIDVPGEVDTTAVLARLLGDRLAGDLLAATGDSDLTALTATLARHCEDAHVMAALFTRLGPNGVTTVAGRVLDSGPWVTDLLVTPEREAWLSARPRFVEAFGTGLGTALSAPTGTWDAADATATAWLTALPEDDLGATGARATLGALDDARAAALVDRVPSLAVLLMRPHDLPPRFAHLVEAANEPATLERVAQVRAAFQALSSADRAYLARVEPWLVGNLDGIPLATRAAANRTAIHAAVVHLETQLDEGDPHPWDYDWQPTVRTRLDTFRGLLDEDAPIWRGGREVTARHQVVLFEPDLGFRGYDQTRLAEVVGDLDAAQHVGVLVPGTGTNVDGSHGQRTRAYDFVRGSQGKAAMITWMGGALPQVLTQATSTAYATDLGPRLAAFTTGMDAPTGAPVTVLGHSYGGSVVGAAEAAGMRVDRVVHVASAGIGPSVAGVQDYADPDTDRYTLTAPGDPIVLSQTFGEFVHGGNPAGLTGITRLETGWVDDQRRDAGMLEGLAAHSGVFDRRTTAWENMLNVVTGGTVTLRVPPQVKGGMEHAEITYPAEDPTYAPPTQEVP